MLYLITALFWFSFNSVAQLNPLEPNPGVVDEVTLSNAFDYKLAGYCTTQNGDVTIDFGVLTFVTPCNNRTGIYFLRGLDVSSEIFTNPIRQCITQVPFTTRCSAFVTNNLAAGPSVIINSYADINSLNEATYTLSGICSQNGQDVYLNVGGILVFPRPVCTSNTWSSTINTSSLSEGLISISADHSDGLGNNAPTHTISVNKDSIGPILTITAGDINSANFASYSLNGTCGENGADVDLDIGGFTPSPQPTCSGGLWSLSGVNLSSLPDGAVTITANHSDLAGNITTQMTMVTKDTMPPGNPSGLALSATWITGANPVSSPLFSWFNIPSDFDFAEVALGTSLLGEEVVAWGAADNVTDHTFTGLTLTECIAYIVSARSVDDGGNRSGGTSFLDFKYDNTNPIVPIISSVSNDATMTTGATTIWSGGSDNCNLDRFEISVSTTPDDSGQLVAWQDVGTGLSGAVTGLSLTGGSTYYTIIRAVDEAGLISSVGASAPWIFYQAPDAPTDLETGAVLENSVEIAWTIPADNGSPITDYIVEFRLSPSGPWTIFNDGISDDNVATVTGLMASTNYDFQVRAENLGGESIDSNIATGETVTPDPFFVGLKAFNLGGAVDSTIVAFHDTTEIQLNGVVIATIDRGDTFQFVSVLNDVIEADKEFYVAGRIGNTAACTGSGNVAWSIKDWAGKNFLFDFSRYGTMNLTVHSFEDATVEVYRDGLLSQTQFVPDDTNHTFVINAYDLYRIQSSGTIIAYVGAVNFGDTYPLLPTRKDLIGVPSNAGYYQAGPSATNYTRWYSTDNAGISGTFSSTAINILSGTGSQYSGAALRVIADDPIAGHSRADADGCQSTPYLPRTFQRKNFAVNTVSEWVKFVSDQPAIVTRTNPDASTSTITLTKTGTATEALYHARLSNVLAGTIFESDKRMGVWYEPNTTSGAAIEDETILFGWDY